MIKHLLAVIVLGSLVGCSSIPTGPQAVSTPKKVAVLHLDGEIDRWSEEQFKEDVAEIINDKDVTAVLLSVNSPGGGVYESSLAFDELAKIQVPVIAYCNEVCASGAVYTIMAPSVKKIYVNRATVIGSVGVFSVRQRSDKPDNIDIYKSGIYKLAGALTKKEAGEDEYLQHIIMEMANQFYDLVDASRGSKISKESWVHIKNAEVFVGREGVARGLADGVESTDGIFKLMERWVGSSSYEVKDIRHDKSNS